MPVALMIIAISAMNIIVAIVINTIYTITVIVSKGTDENTFFRADIPLFGDVYR